ncbi:transmembrane protein, putative [Medicago truncatula]|uniref:Transmembrane protein, putative n=1 Tax=Medicago truncatula TaxID=3880 RepID=A0A072V9M8_MEDTR|nr:transmembrane protein, putative [Medicago truncatula]
MQLRPLICMWYVPINVISINILPGHQAPNIIELKLQGIKPPSWHSKASTIAIFFILSTCAYLAMSSTVVKSSIAAKTKHEQWMKDFKRVMLRRRNSSRFLQKNWNM